MGIFNFSTNLSTVLQESEEKGKRNNSTKNVESAKIEILQKDIDLIKTYLDKKIHNKDFFLFPGHNKAGSKQCSTPFFVVKWQRFKKEKSPPAHLLWYSLKHTANYNSMDMGFEASAKLNHQKDIKVAYEYVKHQIKKDVITVREGYAFYYLDVTSEHSRLYGVS